MRAVQRVTGRRQRLQTLLHANGMAGKAGAGGDAPRWWRDGQLAQLETYCARDVEGLAELVLREELRLPGKQVTREASVLHLLQEKGDEVTPHGSAETRDDPQGAQARRAGEKHARATRADDGTGGRGAKKRVPPQQAGKGSEATPQHEVTQRVGGAPRAEDTDGAADAARTGGAHAGGGAEAEDGGDEEGDAQRAVHDTDGKQKGPERSQQGAVNERHFRKRKARNYDEVERRGPRPPPAERVRYLERTDRGGGCKRRAVVMGAAAVERVVRGRYEWRDSGLRTAVNGPPRKRYWDGVRKHEAQAARRQTADDGEAGHEQVPLARGRAAGAHSHTRPGGA